MAVQNGKTFIGILLAVVLMGALFLGQNQGMSKAPVALAQNSNPANDTEQPATPEASAVQRSEPVVPGTNFEDGYRAGYRDAQRDLAAAETVTTTGRATGSRYAPRARVAGARYHSERRKGHSTRNMILRIAAPAALGAGIGAIAGGKRGAGAGALIGGGAGAMYHLIKHSRD